jgi:hypothetical protein
MKISLRKRAGRPAVSTITKGMTMAEVRKGMTMAEVMTLPAITDLISAGRALGMGRTRSYELARAGSFSCRVERVGRIYQVPTASLLAVLGIPVPCTNCAGRRNGK